jgi:hypothetical protein
MNQILEERIARLATVLDAESTALELQPREVPTRAGRRPKRRVVVLVATIAALALVSATWVVASRHENGAAVHTDPAANAPTTTAPSRPDLKAVQLSAAQQVDWLTRQYQGEASAHIPGWRVELSAERVECDYTGVPDVSVSAISGSANEFPLGESITAERLVQECSNGTDATRAAGVDLRNEGALCTSVSTRRVVIPSDRSAAPTDVVVTEPSVIFTGGSCEASGYVTPAPDFVDSIEQQRRTEILLRAVPRLCPTADETRAWVEHQIETLPDHWTVDVTERGGCALPSVDWWTHRVFT